MTVIFDIEQAIYRTFVNTGNVEDLVGISWEIMCNSLYSKSPLFVAPMTLETSNTRYSEFTFELDMDLSVDLDGIYELVITRNGEVFDKSMLKVVNGTKPLEDVRFTSENEERIGAVLFRPKD